MRSVDEQAHQATSKGTSDGNGHDPGQQQQTHPLEVDGLEGTVAQTDADSGAGDAHRRRDGEGVLREDQDGDGGAQFHRATAAGGVVGDLVAHDYSCS